MDAKTPNPYEAPQTEPVKLAAAKTAPHGTSIRREAWRGAKFGARVTAVIFGVLYAIAWFHLLSLYISGVQSGELLELLAEAFFCILSVLLLSLYGGIVGAIVMSLAAIVRRLRQSPPKPE